MFANLLALVAGLALLAAGSDRFVLGAASLARNLGLSPMVIGLTVVALGTSAPEMFVGTVAAWQGNPNIALGNVLGSNIANVCLVIGASAVVAPMLVASRTLRREFPMLFAVTALAWLLSADGHLSRLDGSVLMLILCYVIVMLTKTAREALRSDPLRQELDAHPPTSMPTRRALLWFVLGLATLLVGSRFVVWGASEIARGLGVSDLIIGLTVVAVGTSLPELAASAMCAIKGEPDIAIGNVLGSNMFNLLPVLGVAALVRPFVIAPEALYRDFPIMVAVIVVFYLMCVRRHGPRRVSRLQGFALLAVFLCYQGSLYHAAL